MDTAALLAEKQLRQATIPLDWKPGETVEFHLTALSRPEYQTLVDAHPPIEEGKDWNPDTFAPALIAACVTEPQFTIEQATELWNTWEPGATGSLFLACWQINDRTAGTTFGLPGFVEGINGSGQNSDTATTKASLTADS